MNVPNERPKRPRKKQEDQSTKRKKKTTKSSTKSKVSEPEPSRRLPGDLSERKLLARIIRVDHAGEFGAQRIYSGQLAILKNTRWGPIIQHMAEQEDVHYEAFERLIVERRIRPTLMRPIWHVVGYALGVATSLIDPRAAMACTVAVEETIDEHYRRQIVLLGDTEVELREMIEKFRADELEHRDIGLDHQADETIGYPLLYSLIKTGSRVAIWISERI